MDILKDRQTKTYEYVSRYSTFPFYYNTLDNKYIYGLTRALDKNVEYVAHKVTQFDTLDYLSFKYYGRPDLYWVIADFNNIIDPYKKLWKNYSIIKVPSLSAIGFAV